MKSVFLKSLLLPVLAAVLMHGFSSLAYGQCLTLASDTIVGVYQEYITTDTVLNVTNATNSSVSIESISMISGDSGIVTMEAPPITFSISPGSGLSIPVHINFSCPAIKDVYTETFEIESASSAECTPTFVTFIFNVLGPITVIPFQLDFPTFDTLSLNRKTCGNFYIRNTTPDTYNITQIILSDDPRAGVHWSLDSLTKLPWTLAPGDVLLIPNLCVIATDTTPLTGSLKFVYDCTCSGMDSAIVPLHGQVKQALADVKNDIPQTMGFTINPNPAHGEVTISLPSENYSTVEIYDVLGNLLLRKQASGQYIWSGETPGGIVAAGAYIVRVAERETNGLVAVSSKRLIFQR